MQKVLVVGQTPPPVNGQTVMIKAFLDGQYDGIHLHHVRMTFSRTIDEVGSFQLRKLTILFSTWLQIVVGRLKSRATTLYFPPAGPTLIPVIRDILLLLSTRWMFKYTVFHFHAAGLTEIYPRLPRILKPLFNLAYRNADLAIFTAMSRTSIGYELGAKMVTAVPYGIADEAGPHLERDASTGSVPTILFMGILCEGKGLITLIEACGRLRKQGVAFRVVCGGTWDASTSRPDIERLLDSHGLLGSFVFAGVLQGEAKWNAFRQADIFCFPSHYFAESSPVVLTEAMSFGLPIVTTKWRGIPDVVGKTGGALLVEPKRPDLVAECLKQLLSDTSLRTRMGIMNRTWFLGHGTLEQYRSKMERAIVDAIRLSGPASNASIPAGCSASICCHASRTSIRNGSTGQHRPPPTNLVTDSAVKPAQHLAYIDALRGVAILMVVAVHVAQEIPLKSLLGQVASFGAKGVQLFFIVSALTLMMSMKKRTTVESNPLRNFFLRRFFRIAPAFYLVLLLYIVVGPFIRASRTGINTTSVSHALLVATFLNGWRPDWINVPVVGQWSIAIEVLFYLLLPFLFPFLTSFRKAVLGWGASMLLYVASFYLAVRLCAIEGFFGSQVLDFAYWWFPSQLPIFFYGIGLYFILAERISLGKIVLAYVPATLLIILVHRSLSTVGLLPVVGLALMLFVILVARRRSILIVNPVTRFLGKISFSVYLVHPLVISSVKRIFTPRLVPNDLVRFGLSYAAVLIMVAPITILTWSFIEVPGQKLCRFLIVWLDTRSGALQAEQPTSGSD